MNGAKCREADCWNTAVAQGYCSKHAGPAVEPVQDAAPEGTEQQRIAIAQAEAQARQKSAVAAIVLGICVGYLGADRFYVGHYGAGIAKLLTCGGAGIWWIIDLFIIGKAVEDANVRASTEAFQRQGLLPPGA